jgi:hypothetical protein
LPTRTALCSAITNSDQSDTKPVSPIMDTKGVYSGRIVADLSAYPKLVGGSTKHQRSVPPTSTSQRRSSMIVQICLGRTGCGASVPLCLSSGDFGAVVGDGESAFVGVRRRSSAIIIRQMWLANRRLRHRMASLQVLPSAIFLSK